MTTGDGEPLFTDTNILVYSVVRGAPLHDQAVEALARLRSRGTELWISRQIVREFLATVTRPQTFALPRPPAAWRDDIDRFQRDFHIAEDGPAVTAELLDLLARFPSGGKQIHDANIVATMRAHGVRQLLTHNIADFARFASAINVVPLA